MKSKAIDRRALPAGASLSTWSAPDGWPHRRMDWPQPDGASPRGSLLFAGGRGDFIEKYIEAYGWWHGRGWNVTAFDWRAQGGSRGKVVGGHLDDFDPLVGDVAALIEAWRTHTKGPHVAVAHSMGAHLLLRALAERRPAIDAAVLVAPMLGINSGPLPLWGASWLASFLSRVGWRRQPAWGTSLGTQSVGSPRHRNLTSCRERYEDELWWWRREPGYNSGAPSWGWFEAAFRSIAAHTPALLAKVETPILFLGSERDRLVGAEAIRRAAAAIPRAELLMFEDAAHEILRDSDPVRLAAFARIDEFLDAHAPRR